MKKYDHWLLETDEQKILWLTLDRKDATVNALSQSVLKELEAILDDEDMGAIKGLVLRSGKSSGFIAGADISEFKQLTDTDVAYSKIRETQILFDRIESLAVPTVALIDGFCMGGGTELVLACQYRLASDRAETVIGLPEVKLGIHPGWGGSVRLSRLIGPLKALPIMLTGRALKARQAKKLKLVDEVHPNRQLKRAALRLIQEKPNLKRSGCLAKILQFKWCRHLIATLVNRGLKKKVLAQHYPAPYALVECWRKAGVGPLAMKTEARSVATLMQSETAKMLLRVFFLQEQLKAFSKKRNDTFDNVHVIGAGAMGGDIAAWCALRGMRVTLSDQSLESIAKAIHRASKLFQKKLRCDHLVQAAMDRLIPDPKGHGLVYADVVIEAIVERLEVKQALFKTIEQQAPNHALLATNTSSIPLEAISSVLSDPKRLVGLHFFNPVAKMPLVEVVRSSLNSDELIGRACRFVGLIKKQPLPVKSAPGFLVNRILVPCLLAAMKLMEDGHTPKAIDEAALSFGMPMGPVTLADKVGLDICLSVANNLANAFSMEVPVILSSHVEAAHLGIKSGRGFYRYRNGSQIDPPHLQEASADNEPLLTALIQPMLEESLRCLSEKVVDTPDLVDAGMIFGAGFAPFRGGPCAFLATSSDFSELTERLQAMVKEGGFNGC